jgi:oligopeptide transport system permease protein
MGKAMILYILKRLLAMIPVLWIIATLTFVLMKAAPGGPFDSERQIPAEILKNIEEQYHLNDPLLVQYGRFLGQLARFDLGPSFRYAGRSVNDIIAETFPVSATLGILALIYALLLGVAAGLFAASKPNSVRDYSAMGISMLGICMPSFVIGPLLVLVFASTLKWLPVAGWDSWKDMILPSLTLGTSYAAYISRLTRAGLMDIIRQDYIRTAKAKGLSGFAIMVRHTMRGGLLPVVSFMGPAVAAVVTGSLVVETIFNIPGLGRFFVQSALNRDYTLVMGTVLFLAVLVLLCNLVTDVIYAFLDPRVRYE